MQIFHRAIAGRRYPPSLRFFGSALIVASALAGCASGPPIDAEWRAPEIASKAGLLRGSVLVACEAPDAAIRNICQDRMAAQLAARGARPILPPPEIQLPFDRPADEALVAAARSAGADAVLIVTLRPVASEASGPSVSFGLGGFGFGRGGFGGGGVGVSAPIGEQRVATAFGANGRVVDVGSGHLVWTASATAPASNDLQAEFTDLSGAILASATRAGLL